MPVKQKNKIKKKNEKKEIQNTQKKGSFIIWVETITSQR